MTPIQELNRFDELEAKIATLQSELFAERAMHRRELMNLTKVTDVAGNEAAQRECDWRNAAAKFDAGITTPAQLIAAIELRQRELDAKREQCDRNQMNLTDATMMIEQLAKELGVNPVWSRSYNIGRIREEIAKLRAFNTSDSTALTIERKANDQMAQIVADADDALRTAGFTGPEPLAVRIRNLHEKATEASGLAVRRKTLLDECEGAVACAGIKDHPIPMAIDKLATEISEAHKALSDAGVIRLPVQGGDQLTLAQRIRLLTDRKRSLTISGS